MQASKATRRGTSSSSSAVVARLLLSFVALAMLLFDAASFLARPAASPFARGGVLRAAAAAAAAAALGGAASGGGATSGNASADAAWAALVRFREWDGLARSDARLCSNAQRGFVPRPLDADLPLGAGGCPASPGYETGPTPAWRTLAGKMMDVDCLYAGSPSASRLYPALPAPGASVYLVFAMASREDEAPPAARVRLALAAHTLRSLRAQFGARIEITLVELFRDFAEPRRAGELEALFGRGTINTVISGVRSQGQDWAMYQEGLQAAWHRLARFEWVVVMNDVMVGPLAPLEAYLAQADRRGARLLLASNWGGCCMRGFFLAFSRAHVASDSFRRFWQRASFPCGKLGPMFVGEASLSQAPLWWGASCATATQHPLSKTDELAVMMASGSPFLYRAGLVRAFTGADAALAGAGWGGAGSGERVVAADGNVTDLGALFAFLELNERGGGIEPHIEDCGKFTVYDK
jgi:hypothetical protein